MLIIKVALPLSYSSMKKNHKDSVDFWHRKMTLKIRIALFFTFKTQRNARPRIFLYTQSWSWGYVYSSLNSAMLSWGHARGLVIHWRGPAQQYIVMARNNLWIIWTSLVISVSLRVQGLVMTSGKIASINTCL